MSEVSNQILNESEQIVHLSEYFFKVCNQAATNWEKEKARSISKANDRFKTGLNYNTYNLADISREYNDQVAKNGVKWVCCLLVRVKLNAFSWFDSDSIIELLDTFGMERENYGFFKRAATWLIQFFMTSSRAPAIAASLSLISR